VITEPEVSWEYKVLTVKNPDVSGLEQRLSRYGSAGWEIVSAMTTVKTWVNLSGNDLVLIFKRRGADDADRSISVEPQIDPATGFLIPD
jgi:hypothetical protein